MSTTAYIHNGAQPLYPEWFKQEPLVVHSWRELARFLVDAEIHDFLRQVLRPGLNLMPPAFVLAAIQHRERRVESVYRRLLRQRKKHKAESFKLEVSF